MNAYLCMSKDDCDFKSQRLVLPLLVFCAKLWVKSRDLDKLRIQKLSC